MIVAVFWWVGTTHAKQDVTMALETITQYDIAVPVFRNTKDIPAHTKLQYYVQPKKVLAPLQTTMTSEAPPQKKRKA